jgi:hypothetical protein
MAAIHGNVDLIVLIVLIGGASLAAHRGGILAERPIDVP